MTRKVIPVERREIERYGAHGIAKVKITGESLGYSEGYLVEFSLKPQPTRAWINRHPNCIELIVAGDKVKNASERSIEVDRTKKLVGFNVDGIYKKETANAEMIKPLYRENGSPTSS